MWEEGYLEILGGSGTDPAASTDWQRAAVGVGERVEHQCVENELLVFSGSPSSTTHGGGRCRWASGAAGFGSRRQRGCVLVDEPQSRFRATGVTPLASGLDSPSWDTGPLRRA